MTVGFGCKVSLARELSRRHFNGRHYTWFATELNPIQNGDSSNPLRVAPLGSFHPELCRIRLDAVDAARVHKPVTNNGWDEQWIEDLAEGEFEVIVD